MTIFIKNDKGMLKTFAQIEKEIFEQCNILLKGNISKIAEALKISRTRVYRKLKGYKIKIEKPVRIIKNIELREVSIGKNGDLEIGGFVDAELPKQKIEVSQAVGPADILPSEAPALPENAIVIDDHLKISA